MTVSITHSSIQTNGILMHVASTGPEDATPMVLLHGFPEGWASWRPIMERLGDRYRMHALDLRGYGGTQKPPKGYDLLSLTNDVDGALEALGAKNPILVGHDWGGGLAWVMGHRFGPKLRHLVVVNCTHPKTLLRGVLQRRHEQHKMSWYMAAFQIPAVPEYLLTRNGGDLLRRTFHSMAGDHVLNAALVDELVANFPTPADVRGPLNFYREAARMQLSLKGRQQLAALYAHPISCPTTLVFGERDLALTPLLAQESHLDARCPVEWRPLPGVGHFVSLEAPEKLAVELDRVGQLHAAGPAVTTSGRRARVHG